MPLSPEKPAVPYKRYVYTLSSNLRSKNIFHGQIKMFCSNSILVSLSDSQLLTIQNRLTFLPTGPGVP